MKNYTFKGTLWSFWMALCKQCADDPSLFCASSRTHMDTQKHMGDAMHMPAKGFNLFSWSAGGGSNAPRNVGTPVDGCKQRRFQRHCILVRNSESKLWMSKHFCQIYYMFGIKLIKNGEKKKNLVRYLLDSTLTMTKTLTLSTIILLKAALINEFISAIWSDDYV